MADVIVLLTSWAHNASENQAKLVDEHNRILKNRNITIVGLVGGNEDDVRKWKPNVERWSSPNLTFESKLDDLDEIARKIVHSLCASSGKRIEKKRLNFRHSKECSSKNHGIGLQNIANTVNAHILRICQAHIKRFLSVYCKPEDARREVV